MTITPATPRSGRAPSRRFGWHLLLASSILAGMVATSAQADDLPTGASVAGGAASVATNGSAMTVTQTTARAVINWNGFSVGTNNSVDFRQPDAQSATLNRVTGATTSDIAGRLTSNGALYLVNPNGIVVTKTGSVETGGGFVASTLDIADPEFMAGRLNFAGKGSSAKISNAGRIAAGQGAYVALLGGSVANSGYITVPLGKVALGSGEQIALDINGGNFMQVGVPSSAMADGGALVDNSGAMAASGGTVMLQAATLKGIVRNVVNMSGSINADSAIADGGTIELLGGDGGMVTASGTLSARATGANGNGGLVETSGEHVQLGGLAVDTTSASGKAGRWLIDPVDFAVAASAGDITGAQLSANLATSNVVIRSAMGAAGTSGDVIVNDAVSWSSGNSLTLSAFRNVNVNSAISAIGANAALVLQADSSGTGTGTVIFGAAGNATLSGNGSSASLYYNPASFGTPTDFGGKVSAVTVTTYQLVNMLDQLQAINSFGMSNNYALARDIDASPTATWNGGAGFVPIGTDGVGVLNEGYGFTGAFDGQGHVISSLTVSRPSASYAGLFGVAGPSSRISNLGLLGGSISGQNAVGGLVGWAYGASISQAYATGNVSGASLTGGLAGQADNTNISQAYATGIVSGGSRTGGLVGLANSTTIIQAYATGNVSGASQTGGLVGAAGGAGISQAYAIGNVSGASQTGGLVGAADRTSISNVHATGRVTGTQDVGGLAGYTYFGDIGRAYATGNITDSGDYAGGLVGQSDYGTISQSYATGGVSSTGYYIGGLAGYSSGTITQTYATGGVSTNWYYAGGLVGYAYLGTVSESYATGSVSGNAYVGGLVGNSGFASISSSYWDKQTSGQSTMCGGGAGGGSGCTDANGLTTAQARSAGSYPGWDFTNIWYQAGDLRPILRSEAAGAVNGVIPISNLHQLALVGANLNASYVLTADVNASETSGSNASGVWSTAGFVPLGTNGAGSVLNGGNGFVGSLDGLGHIISGLTINRPSADYIGLFGRTGASTHISNVGVVGGSSTGHSFVGGLVGWNSYGSIDQAYATAAVSGNSSVGGLVGFNASGTITRSYATGNISSNSDVGGLVGDDNNGTINQSYATGSVSGSSDVGGLVGYTNTTTIRGSYANSNVSGTGNYVGGLVGLDGYFGSVDQSYATGTVSGTGDNVGGLMGYNYGGSISRAYATGSVSGRSAVGGLIGYNSGTISQSFATGGVLGQGNEVGGLVGYSYGGIIGRAYATGSVSGQYEVGGLVGEADYGNISQSYATGDVAGSLYVGGLVGYVPYGSISQAYATGAISGQYAGGLVGYSFNGGISEAYASGNVAGSAYIGGLVGVSNGGTIASSFWDKQTSGQTAMCGYVGGSGCTDANGLTTPQARTAGSYTGWDFTSVWYQAGDMRPILRSEAAAAVNGVILVSNLHQLALVGANLGASYALTSDIDATATAGSNASGIWSTSGFVPLGTDGGHVFVGSLDGQGHSIANLTISRPSDTFVGLFGYAGGGSISNLSVLGSSISGYYYVGGVVGFAADESVSNVYATGAVNGYTQIGGLAGAIDRGNVSQSHTFSTVSGTTFVGGLVGWIDRNNGTSSISQSYANGNVSGSAYVGGLAGRANSQITASYATGAVTGSQTVGGLIGDNYGEVSQSHASGTVAGGDDTGGLVGFNYGTISDSYVGGNVSGGAHVGGLVGYNYFGAITNTHTGGSVTGGTHVGGLVGYNWDGNISSSHASGTVTGSGDYIGGLVGINDWYGIISQSYATGNVTGANQVGGLVGNNDTGTSIIQSYASGNASGTRYIGGLVGANDGGSISNAYASGVVAGGTDVGGLVGYHHNGSVTYAYATGGVSGSSDRVGGLVGTSFQATLSQVHATGVVSSAGSQVGGLVGSSSQSSIGQAYAVGNVAGDNQVGGLTGLNAGSTITQAFATGSVSGLHNNIGGLVGVNTYGSVNQTYATGTVIGGLAVGGLVGNNYVAGSIDQSYATGSVTGAGAGGGTGGLVGYNQGTISETYATGAPSGGTQIGGLVGNNVSGVSISRSYWDTQTSGRSTMCGAAGGAGCADLNGMTTAQLQDAYSISDTTYDGWNFNSVWAVPTLVGQAGQTSSYYPQLYALSPIATVVPDNATRLYGAANPALTGSIHGGPAAYVFGPSGDSLQVSSLLTTSADQSSSVGSYVITALVGGAIISPGGVTYRVIVPDSGPFSATLTVTPAPLTITYTANPATRLYGAVNPAFTGSVGALGLVNGDSLGAVTSGAASFGSTATQGTGVGSYAVNGSGLVGNSANYDFTFAQAAANATALTINPAPLTVAYIADPKSRIYGAANPALSGVIQAFGLVNGDAGADVITGTPNFSSAATSASSVGTYAIVGSGLSGNSNNYAFAFLQAPGNVTALTINPAGLTVTYTADAKSRTYGAANPAFSGSVDASGLVNSDTLAGVTSGAASFGSTATAGANVGSYAVNGSGLAGNSANYDFIFAQAAANATALTINPAPLTVTYTADAMSRTYGAANPAFTGSVGSSGLVNGESLSDVTSGAASFGSAATQATGVGSYAVNGSGLAGTSSNYNVTFAQALANATALTINPAPLTVAYTADAKSRTYGAPNPAFTGSVGASGLVNGDTLAGVVGGSASFTSPASSSSYVGSYAINGSGLIGNSANYNIAFVQAVSNATALAINPAPLTVTYTANVANRTYGAANPAFPGSASGTGLVNGDTIATVTSGTATFSSTATANSNVGQYAITGSGLLARSGNYNFSFVQAGGNSTALTITAAPLVITYTADPMTRLYNTPNPKFTGVVAVNGLVNGNTLAGVTSGKASFDSPAVKSSPVGSYAVNGSGLSGSSSNYSYSFIQAPGNATALTITNSTCVGKNGKPC